MRKDYLRLLLWTYALALLLCVGSRTYLMLGGYIDNSTGLYSGGFAFVWVFNISLLVFIGAWFVLTILRRGNSDYPIYFNNPLVRVLLILTGAGILACVVADSIEVISKAAGGWVYPNPFSAYLATPPTRWGLAILVIKIVTGLLGAAALTLFALRNDLGSGKWRMIGASPAVWQIVVLLERFTGYIAPVHISDTLLMILFMVFSPIFLIGQSRTICGFKPPDSRNYLIASGFAASLAGFSLTIPKIVLAIGTADISLHYNWLFFFNVYVFIFSVYTAVFLYSYIRAIRKV